MPDGTRCLHCHRVGFVRIERVAQGDRAITDYYCAACERGWAISDGDWASGQPRGQLDRADARPPRPRR